MNGVIIINKEKNFTSFDVVAVLRRLFCQKKIGHTGTLDPMATGVLPVMLGKATKTIDLILDHDKEYKASFAFGKETDTQDSSGKVLKTCDIKVRRENLVQVLKEFQGEGQQIPPMYSAVKKEGKKLYTLARQGIEIKRESRQIKIYALELLEFSEEKQKGSLLVFCSKGMYIRTLCADLAKKLGTFGTMTDLRRTKACGFSLDQAYTLRELNFLTKEDREKKVLPMDSLFLSYPKLEVIESQAQRFCNGRSLKLDQVQIKQKEEGSILLIYNPQKDFLGLGKISLERSEIKVYKLLAG